MVKKLKKIINPALEELLKYGIPVTDSAKVMLYAIGLQESRFIHRFQIPLSNSANGKGPARGFWQFEVGGGVAGVMRHKSTANIAATVTKKICGSTNYYAVWATLEYEDVLAAVFARLLLWCDSKALPKPTLENEQEAWNYYIRNWRPGKPHRETWTKNWSDAIKAVL